MEYAGTMKDWMLATNEALRGAERRGYERGIEEAARLMETHICDYGTVESFDCVPLKPITTATPGMKSRAAAIRELGKPKDHPSE